MSAQGLYGVHVQISIQAQTHIRTNTNTGMRKAFTAGPEDKMREYQERTPASWHDAAGLVGVHIDARAFENVREWNAPCDKS